MQRTAIINGESNLWQDRDVSNLITWIVSDWVLTWFTPTQVWWAWTNITIPLWKAFVWVTRTWTPAENFYVLFENTEDVILTCWNSKKIFIEIPQVNIDDPTQNTNADWTWIWEIKIADVYPSWNYISLWETDWSWLYSNVNLKNLVFNSDVISKSDLVKLDINWNLNISWDITGTNFIWNWSQLTWLSAEVSSSSLQKMLWKDWWIVWRAYSQVNYEQLTWWTDNNFWNTTDQEVAQSFYWQDLINEATFNIKKVWNDRNDIYAEIQWDNAWIPDWIAQATSDTILKANLTTSYTEQTFTNFNFTPEPWVLYHIVLKWTWTDINDYFQAESWWSDLQIWTMSKNTSWTWANATDDLYFKLPADYQLAILWGNNFIWICQANWNIWEIKKFNTWYDNNQSWLTAWNYYWFNSSTWIIGSWTIFRAISDTELNIEIINQQIFWDWSDWDLIVDNNYDLALNSLKQFNNITINSWKKIYSSQKWVAMIKCRWTLILNWDINLIWNWEENLDNVYGKSVYGQLYYWTWWAWWNWWSDGAGSDYWAWWAWWTTDNVFWWWWGWWSANESKNWWTWWTWWTPWWNWWAWWNYASWQSWWISSWWWGWWWFHSPWWNWWNAYWSPWWDWGWQYANSWWGWWWWWWKWGWLLLFAKNIIFNWWNIKCDWWAWWNGWNWYGRWGWWWGWWWWGWWFVMCLYSNISWTIDVSSNWWAWWNGWTSGSSGAWWAWWNWTNGTRIVSSLYELT